MTNQPALVKQSDLTRYLKAARNAGYPVARFEIAPDGVVVIYPGNPSPDDEPNPWDKS